MTKHLTSPADRELGRFLSKLGLKAAQIDKSPFHAGRYQTPNRLVGGTSDHHEEYVIKTYGNRDVGYVKVLAPKAL